MDAILRDVTGAARRLLRAPVFTLVAVITVGVGIGAFASVFSVVDAVLLEQPAYEQPDELRFVWRKYWFGLDRGWLGGPDIVKLREHTDAFDGVVALRSFGMNLSSQDGSAPRSVRVMTTSAGLFGLLGVSPALGRGFQPGEDGPEPAPVAVLAHDLWRTQFAADPGLVGRDIFLDGTRVTVVGVAPEDFHFVQHTSLGEPAPADLWMPMGYDLASLDSGSGMFAALARVADGASPAQVDAAVAAVARDIDAEWGNPGLEMRSVALLDDLVAPVRPALWALLGSASFLLLVLAANLATLLMGRAALRDRELAVRSALGAGRGRLLRSVLAESVVLGAAGATLGVGLAILGVGAIRAIAPPSLPRLWAVDVDASVVAASVAVAALMTLAAGLAPAAAALRSGVAVRLRGWGRAGAGRTARSRGALVVLQLSLSLMLLVGAGLLARAFADLTRSDPGFDGRGTLTFGVPLDPVNYPDDAAALEFDRRFREAVAALPGVAAVGASEALPLSTTASQRPVMFPGAPGNTGDEDVDAPLIDMIRMTPGFVEAAGMRVLAGRPFTDGDGTMGREVALVDDLLADRFFPSGGAVGASLVLFADTFRIVGVVDQARQYTVHSDDRSQVYIPKAYNAFANLSYVVRPAPGGRAPVETLRRTLATLDPALPLTDVRPMDEILAASLGRERLSLTLSTTFAVGALLLAMLGVYGVVSNTVTRRTHELGVRMALGAERARVTRMVVGQGVRLGMAGLAVGFAAAVVLTPLLEGVVVGLDPSDPWVYGTVATALLTATLAASFVPARRATRIDPVAALRQE